jgi:hypothetical protein
MFVKYIEISEKCLNHIKYLKTQDLTKWKEEHAKVKSTSANETNSIEIDLEKDTTNCFSNQIEQNVNTKKALHNQGLAVKTEKIEKKISNYFLILANFPKDVTRIEIIELSKDIHRLYINHEIDKKGVLLKRYIVVCFYDIMARLKFNRSRKFRKRLEFFVEKYLTGFKVKVYIHEFYLRFLF